MEFPNTYLTSFTIPTGATSGARIVLDGVTGRILVYNSSNMLVDTIGGPDGDITSTDGTSTVTIHSGSIHFTNPLNNSDAILSIAADLFSMVGPTSVPFGFAAEIQLRDGLGTSTGVNAPIVYVRSPTGGIADIVIQGTVIQADAGGTKATWQTPVYNSGWLGGPNGGTTHALQYRLDPLNNLVLVGAMHTTSATPNVIAFTLPVGYRTLMQWRSIININNGAGYAQFNTNGDVNIVTNPAAIGVDIYFTVMIPIGNIP